MFPDGSEEGSISCGLVAIVDDNSIESTESFFATLQSTDETLATINPNTLTTIVSIEDDDCKIVYLN